MKVAIMGSSGYIAGYLIDRLKRNLSMTEIIKIDAVREEGALYLELSSPESFDYSVFQDVSYLIFMAAVSSPDQCGMEFKSCWKINVEGTGYVIRQALNRGCRVIFFSSDAVFESRPGRLYDESSETTPQTAYGKMKKRIEDKFKGEKGFKAVRLSYVVSAKDRFTSYCIRCFKTGQIAEIFHPFYRNCITATEVLDTVEWLLSNWSYLDSAFLNLAGSELVSRVRIADELNQVWNEKLKYQIVTPSQEFYRNRAKITQIRSKYLYQRNIIKKKSFTEKLKEELEDIKR